MDDLAARANCSNSTIRDFEAHRREPHRNRLATIRQALEVAGIVFSISASGDTASVSGPVRPSVRMTEDRPKRKPPGRTGRSGGNKRKAK
jgi:transcriptional regulator with XRE-family HTH domain